MVRHGKVVDLCMIEYPCSNIKILLCGQTSKCKSFTDEITAGRWFSPDSPVSSTNITEISLKVVLSTINQTKAYSYN
jgi:hypothetical protein